MPEGHTLHRLARTHRRRYVGKVVEVTSPQGRFATSAEIVDGRVLERTEAHGKHLFHHYGPDLVVHVHLGLYGKFSDDKKGDDKKGDDKNGDDKHPVDAPRGLVRMRIVGPTHYADLRGPTTCELITDIEADAVHARLGVDPLRRDADPDRAWARISSSRAPLATLLMDQTVIAGVGNVYRAEALFRHGLDPQLPGKALAREQWDVLWADLVDLLRDGVQRGKIETLRDEHGPRLLAPADGDVPPPPGRGGALCARRVYAYRRTGEPCLVCGTPIAADKHLARNLFWCPTCQPAAVNGGSAAGRGARR